MKNWKVLYKKSPKNTAEVIKNLLDNRGFKTEQEVSAFLRPSIEDLSIDSVGIDKKELYKTVERIKSAIKRKEKIVIYGDYDVDGICGTAILWETLYKVYTNIVPYIPDRFEEGYGLSVMGIDNLLKKHPDIKLIITVDNGIVAYEAAKYAQDKNIDVIITDHHVQDSKKHFYYSLVHTTKLCGTGVAFFLSQQLQGKKKIRSEQFLDLVTLATIADLVPLVGPNRAFVKHGLPVLNRTKRPGLLALFQIAGIRRENIGVYEIGHIICPRLNAMGRLFSAMDSLRLVCTKDPARAARLAADLDRTNKERQTLTVEATLHAKATLNGTLISAFQSKIIFVYHETYNEGIIGLVASRLVEEYHKPAFVLSVGETHAKGSARSVAGINIIEMIRSVSEHVVAAGGHPMAAGFSLNAAKIADFKRALEKRAEELVLDDALEGSLNIDMPLDFSKINFELFSKLSELSPFGNGNPEPVFLTENVNIEEFKTVGSNGKHLKLKLSQCDAENNTAAYNCIAFGIGDRAQELQVGKRVDVVYSISEDTWQGNNSLQLKIKDMSITQK